MEKKLFHYFNKVKVRVLVDMPMEWVGVDMKVYPPLKKGDIILMDKETAELLAKHDRVEILE